VSGEKKSPKKVQIRKTKGASSARVVRQVDVAEGRDKWCRCRERREKTSQLLWKGSRKKKKLPTSTQRGNTGTVSPDRAAERRQTKHPPRETGVRNAALGERKKGGNWKEPTASGRGNPKGGRAGRASSDRKGSIEKKKLRGGRWSAQTKGTVAMLEKDEKKGSRQKTVVLWTLPI